VNRIDDRDAVVILVKLVSIISVELTPKS